MATFRKFEEIECWKKSRELAKGIYNVSSKQPFARDFGLKDQIRRAAVSIMSNIAEGFDRDGKGEFVQFLSQSKGSASEVKCQLYIALDQGYISDTEFSALCDLASETSRMIGGLMNYLRDSTYKGIKYKTPTKRQ